MFDLFGTLIENLRIPEFERMLSGMAEILSLPPRDLIRVWNDTWFKRRIGLLGTLETEIKHVCELLNTKPENDSVYKAVELRESFVRTVLSRTRVDSTRTLGELKNQGTKLDSSATARLMYLLSGIHRLLLPS